MLEWNSVEEQVVYYVCDEHTHFFSAFFSFMEWKVSIGDLSFDKAKVSSYSH
jgi:hypothetical protein